MLKKRDILGMAVMAAILTVTLWLVLGGGKAGQVWAAMRSAQGSWLALGVLLMVCYTGAEALQIKIALGAMGHRVPYRHCCQFAAAGFYFSSITPSATGGQPAEVFYMARRGIPAAHGAITMLLFTIFYQVTTLGYGLAAWLLEPECPAFQSTGLGLLLAYGLVSMLALTVGMVALLVWPRAVERFCRWCLRGATRLRLVRDLAKVEAGLDAQLEEYARGAAIIRHQPALAGKLLVVSAVQQGVRFLVTWTVYRAMGLTALSPFYVVSIQALLYLAVGCLPIPGAVGASEAAFLAAFGFLFGPEQASAAMLLSRGISFYLPLLVTGGVTAALHWETGEKKRAISQKSS